MVRKSRMRGIFIEPIFGVGICGMSPCKYAYIDLDPYIYLAVSSNPLL